MCTKFAPPTILGVAINGYYFFFNNEKTENKSHLTFRELFKVNHQIFHVSFIFNDKHFNLAVLCDFWKVYQSCP